MTEHDKTGTEQFDSDVAPIQEDPDDVALVEGPGFLTEDGEAVGDDGSVVPIIGGLPAVEGSAWDIGAPADERGAELAEHERRRDSPPDQPR